MNTLSNRSLPNMGIAIFFMMIVLTIPIFIKLEYSFILTLYMLTTMSFVFLYTMKKLNYLNVFSLHLLIIVLSGWNIYIPILQYVPIFYAFLLLLFIGVNKSKTQSLNMKQYLYVLSGLVLLSIIFSLIPQFNSIYQNEFLLILYSLIKRNSFLILFLASIYYLDNKKIVRAEKLLLSLVIINTPIILIQYNFITSPDDLTGLFGNISTGVLIYLYVALYAAMKFRSQSFRLSSKILFYLSFVLYSLLAEVKFVIASIIVIEIILSLISSKKSLMKKGINLVIVSFITYLSLIIFEKLYPLQPITDLDYLRFYLFEQSYDSMYSVNRFNFFEQINYYLEPSLLNQLFGYGIGSLNPSDASTFQGALFKEFEFLKLHYFFFSWSFVESGIVGTFLYLTILYFPISIMIFKNGFSYLVKKSEDFSILLFLTLFNTVLLFYNSSNFEYTVSFTYWIYCGYIFRSFTK